MSRASSVQVMEWVDASTCGILLQRDTLWGVRSRLSPARWDYLTNVIITDGPTHSRLEPGGGDRGAARVPAGTGGDAPARQSSRGHQAAQHHAQRTGNAKLIDFGYAFEIDDKAAPRACTPRYAAVEVLMGERCSPVSDLASLGYCLVELLSGRTSVSTI